MIGLVGMGGGMRNAFSSGVLEALDPLLAKVNLLVSASSGALAFAYYLAGQNHLTREIWTGRLTRPELFSARNLLKGKRPADIHYLLDNACFDLNYPAIAQSTKRLDVALFDVLTGQTEFHTLGHSPRPSLVLKGSCGLPLLAEGIIIDGKVKRDGAVSHNIPISYALEQGCERILFIGNQPQELYPEKFGRAKSFLAFPNPLHIKARQAIRRRPKNYLDAINLIEVDERIYGIFPSAILPAQRISQDREAVNNTYDAGLQAGQRHYSAVAEFLCSTKSS